MVEIMSGVNEPVVLIGIVCILIVYWIGQLPR
jgi:hypothetical protein